MSSSGIFAFKYAVDMSNFINFLLSEIPEEMIEKTLEVETVGEDI